MKFELEKYHRNVDDKVLLDDVRAVAKRLNKKSLTIDEYQENGEFSNATLRKRFGSWCNVLEKAGLQQSRPFSVTNEEYFLNMQEVWTKLGRQPKYADMQRPFSKYSAAGYERRFGSWRKALEKFIEYINAENGSEPKEEKEAKDTVNPEPIVGISKHKTKRNISWRLRFIIMKRDGFKCRACGRSPATYPKTVLHVDHIKPYSRGGETLSENLQTLCQECNIGKSDIH